eukprot:jgi/Mesvir1/14706/Mv05360-RA.2
MMKGSMASPALLPSTVQPSNECMSRPWYCTLSRTSSIQNNLVPRPLRMQSTANGVDWITGKYEFLGISIGRRFCASGYRTRQQRPCVAVRAELAIAVSGEAARSTARGAGRVGLSIFGIAGSRHGSAVCAGAGPGVPQAGGEGGAQGADDELAVYSQVDMAALETAKSQWQKQAKTLTVQMDTVRQLLAREQQRNHLLNKALTASLENGAVLKSEVRTLSRSLSATARLARLLLERQSAEEEGSEEERVSMEELAAAIAEVEEASISPLAVRPEARPRELVELSEPKEDSSESKQGSASKRLPPIPVVPLPVAAEAAEAAGGMLRAVSAALSSAGAAVTRPWHHFGGSPPPVGAKGFVVDRAAGVGYKANADSVLARWRDVNADALMEEMNSEAKEWQALRDAMDKSSEEFKGAMSALGSEVCAVR